MVIAPEMAVQRSQRRTLRLFIRSDFAMARAGPQTLIAGPGHDIGFAPLLFILYLALAAACAVYPADPGPLLRLSVPCARLLCGSRITSGSLSRLCCRRVPPYAYFPGWGAPLRPARAGKHGRSQGCRRCGHHIRRIKELSEQSTCHQFINCVPEKSVSASCAHSNKYFMYLSGALRMNFAIVASDL